MDATQYDAFWLWAGVTPQPVLKTAKTIYILEGEVRGVQSAHLISLRPATPTVRHAEVWIVYRVETLNWDDRIFDQIGRDIDRWRAAGNHVAGVQIDFDAATKGLADYGTFLRKLRSRLPEDAKLGVTGLLDWSSQGDSADLNGLAGTIDEIVVQTYQGRHTIAGYAKYLENLNRIRMPYKIGLVQYGQWESPDIFDGDPDFRGYVVFLVNKAPVDHPPSTSEQDSRWAAE